MFCRMGECSLIEFEVPGLKQDMIPPPSCSGQITPERLARLKGKSALGLALTDTERLALELAERERLELELAKPHTDRQLRDLSKEKRGCLWEIELIRADNENTWYPRKQKRIEKAYWRRIA